jgi:hypothetical protein
VGQVVFDLRFREPQTRRLGEPVDPGRLCQESASRIGETFGLWSAWTIVSFHIESATDSDRQLASFHAAGVLERLPLELHLSIMRSAMTCCLLPVSLCVVVCRRVLSCGVWLVACSPAPTRAPCSWKVVGGHSFHTGHLQVENLVHVLWRMGNRVISYRVGHEPDRQLASFHAAGVLEGFLLPESLCVVVCRRVLSCGVWLMACSPAPTRAPCSWKVVGGHSFHTGPLQAEKLVMFSHIVRRPRFSRTRIARPPRAMWRCQGGWRTAQLPRG